ncbi:MAG: hypothetical protein AAF674_17565 [Pseudomonadota bacterium]
MAVRSSDPESSYRLIRRIMALGVCLFATMLAGLWLLAPPDQMPARFSAQDCRQVDLVDRQTGAPIAGAEAIALGPDGRLYLAAHDRLSETANGALYSVSLFALSGRGSVRALRLDQQIPGQTFRPHGLAISANGRRLATINRYAPGKAQVEIGEISPDGWLADRRLEGASLCRANGLAFTGLAPDDLLISLDRRDCSASLADLTPWAQTGRLARFDGDSYQIVREGLIFPNGLVGLYIAETRADRILSPDGVVIPLPGGPDNLSLSDEGQLVAAVHPRVHLLGLYLQGWQSSAPSRIVQADPATGRVEVLFDDPAGQLFSGATGAVLVDGLLIAGSVRDRGLLVCRKGRA